MNRRTYIIIMSTIITIIAPIFGTLFGAIGGYIVSITPLNDCVCGFVNSFGYNINLVEFGAFLGFVFGCFIKIDKEELEKGYEELN